MIKWMRPNIYHNVQSIQSDRACAVIEALREIAEQLAELNKHPTQHVEMHKIKPKS